MKIAAFSLSLEADEINPVSITEMHLISSIDTLAYSCVVRIKDVTGALEPEVKYGAMLYARYFDRDTGKKLLECPLRIMSYEKLCSAAPTTIDEIQITAVSSWYFEQDAERKAYYGTVSSVVKAATERERFFSARSIEESSDAQSLRYQLLETPSSFLERLIYYGVSNSSPMYLFCTVGKKLVLKSKQAMLDSNPVCTLVPLLDGVSPSDIIAGPVVSMYSAAFYAKGERSNSTRKYVFSVSHTPASQEASIKISAAISTIETKETKLVGSVSGSKAEISGWEVPPYDALSAAINRSARLDQDVFSAIAIVPSIAATELDLGSTLNIRMSDSRCPENGTYYVRYIDHQLNNGSLYSKLHLVRIPE